MKKILVYGLSPQKGGVESIVLNVIKHLAEDVKFDILLSNISYDSIYECLPPNVNILQIESWGKNRQAFKNGLFSILAKDSYDYLWINACLMSNRDIISIARMMPNLRIITHSHGSSFEERNIIKRIILLGMHKFNRKYYNDNIDFACMCSVKSGVWFYGQPYLNSHKVFLFNNGIDTQLFKFNSTIRNEYRNKLGLTNKMVLFHAGRLTAVKNQMYLIDILEKCKAKKLNIHLLIAGDGELHTELASYAEKKGVNSYISFLGLRNDIDKLYQASDIFLLPSHHEGFPVTLTEAQTSGIKCLVSSNISREVDITGNVEFFPITPNSINLWVNAIASYDYNQIDRSCYHEIVVNKQFDIIQVAHNFKNFIQA